MSAATASKYGSVPTEDDAYEKESSPVVVVKKKRCNDIYFLLLFVAHLVVVIWSWVSVPYRKEVGSSGASSSSSSSSSLVEELTAIEEQTGLYKDVGVWKYLCIVSLCSIVLSTLALVIMTTLSDDLARVALVLPILGSGATLAYGILKSVVWMMVTGGVLLLLAVIFACCLMKRVDFAASNLRIALTIIRTNYGLIIHAYLLELVAFVWTVIWFGATIAVVNQQQQDQETATEEDETEARFYMRYLIFAGYLFSFFWTHQIINNVQHVVVSSVIGTWWYKPEDANSCWDDGLNKAICHTWTLSFGSICFGSLLAGIFQTLKWLHRMFSKRDTRFQRLIWCCVDCCLAMIQGLVEYFNKWAYAYVGLHGDTYLASGREVSKLFKLRNWNEIIHDWLADAIMFFMKISIALVTGLLGWWLVNRVDNDMFVGIGVNAEDDNVLGFLAGAIVGYVVASIMMELVTSAVNAVIVCFAEAPAVLNKHRPDMCLEMMDAWVKAFPEECSDDFTSVKTYNIMENDYNEV